MLLEFVQEIEGVNTEFRQLDVHLDWEPAKSSDVRFMSQQRHLFGIFLHNPKATMRTTHPIVLGASIVKKVDNVGILPVFGHTIPHTSYAIFAGVE